ncbi:outer membrane protein OmpK [Shewanella sp. GXUN23E]|uniref:outer membrane protein OmpK n=1 Tax=Shewanella sp. GXUN23E TaxID=3422498 RepID=UPI003D7C94FF
MKTSVNAITLMMVILGLSSAQAHAEVIAQQNTVLVGYEYLLNAEDKNPNLYDQPYLVLANTTVADWGSVTGWLRLENPLDTAKNQQDKDAGATTKVWLKLDYNLGSSPFNLWVQSFTNANEACTEQNLYLGASYDVLVGKLKGTVGVGLHYGYGSFSPTGASFHALTGGAVTVMLGYPITPHWFAKFYYESQFNRSDEHRQTFNYDSYGHQAVLGLDYRFNEHWTLGTLYKHRQSWGGALNGGGEVMLEAGYHF